MNILYYLCLLGWIVTTLFHKSFEVRVQKLLSFLMWLIWDNMDDQRFGIISESEF